MVRAGSCLQRHLSERSDTALSTSSTIRTAALRALTPTHTHTPARTPCTRPHTVHSPHAPRILHLQTDPTARQRCVACVRACACVGRLLLFLVSSHTGNVMSSVMCLRRPAHHRFLLPLSLLRVCASYFGNENFILGPYLVVVVVQTDRRRSK